MRWRFWQRRKPRRLEQCSVCGIELKRKREHELRGYPMDLDEVDFRRQGGGTYVSETFCKKHCPGACERGCAVVV